MPRVRELHVEEGLHEAGVQAVQILPHQVKVSTADTLCTGGVQALMCMFFIITFDKYI